MRGNGASTVTHLGRTALLVLRFCSQITAATSMDSRLRGNDEHEQARSIPALAPRIDAHPPPAPSNVRFITDNPSAIIPSTVEAASSGSRSAIQRIRVRAPSSSNACTDAL